MEMNTRATFSDFSLKYLHSQVMDLLKIASKHGGMAYGGYVRDVIVRVQAGDFSEVSVKDVDIWFKSEDNRRGFIEEYIREKGRYIFASTNETSQGVTSMGANRIQHALYDNYGDMLLYVDLIVYEVFPVWDLSVNQVMYDYSTNRIVTNFPHNVSTILKNIREKTAVLDQRAVDLLTDSKSKHTVVIVSIDNDHIIEVYRDTFRKRIADRFIANGWTIYTETGQLVEVNRSGDVETLTFSFTDGC